MSTSVLKIRPLGCHVGAIADDVDVRNVDDEAFAQLASAVFNNGVLVIRGSRLDPKDHLSFTRRFGEVWVPPKLEPYGAGRASGHLPGNPEILVLANAGKAKAYAESWHTDSAYVERPPALSVLAARELPPCGGDTMFANQAVAYDRLSQQMKAVIADLKVEFSNLRAMRTMKFSENDAILDSGKYHPVVRTHPATGRKALYLSTPEQTSSRFEGMTEAESLPIIRFLYDFGHQPDLVYRHRWQDDDILIWDNRVCRHLAVHDYGDGPRVMHRTTVLGEVPV